ncbi:MAG TPA: CBS domain-containing protein [Candidatus Nitrosopolaris sp.]|nr:CBS domain-containing protein [Candidatus Nitrosopolaris sp.]
MTTIGEIMSERLETIDESDTAQHAAKKLRNSNVSSLLVVDGEGKHVGIVTERDLVRRVCAKDVSSSKVIIQEMMSTPVITVDSSSLLQVAASKMIQNKVRHLLIVGQNGAEGIISTRNFTNYLKQKVDMDEVNGAIIQSLLHENEEEGMRLS